MQKRKNLGNSGQSETAKHTAGWWIETNEARDGPADVRKILIFDKSESILLLFNLLRRWWNRPDSARPGPARVQMKCALFIWYSIRFIFQIQSVRCWLWSNAQIGHGYCKHFHSRQWVQHIRAHSPSERRSIGPKWSPAHVRCANENDKIRNAIAAPALLLSNGFLRTCNHPQTSANVNVYVKLIWLYCKHGVIYKSKSSKWK